MRRRTPEEERIITEAAKILMREEENRQPCGVPDCPGPTPGGPCPMGYSGSCRRGSR